MSKIVLSVLVTTIVGIYLGLMIFGVYLGLWFGTRKNKNKNK